MSSTYIYASCKDINGIREYLAASTEKEIEDYCENGTLGHEREILHWYTNPTPIMASSHFIWVGKGKRPPMLSISKPFNYKNPNAIVREKW
jgi:hypothetical protein